MGLFKKNKVTKKKQEQVEAQNNGNMPVMQQSIFDFETRKHELIKINNGSINKPTELLLLNLLENINALHAAVYVLNDEEKNNLSFEKYTTSSEKGKLENDLYSSIENGLVQACFNSEEYLEVQKIPVITPLISDRMVEFFPFNISLFPILFNEACIGVLKILSEDKLEESAIDFAEQYLKKNASYIATEGVSRKLRLVFNNYNSLAKELFASKEEAELSRVLGGFLGSQVN